MKDRNLLASAPSRDGIQDCIIRFYCGTKMTVTEDLQIIRDSDGLILTDVRVVLKKGRYRFEMVQS